MKYILKCFCLALAAGLTAAAVGFGYARCFVIFHKLVRSAQHLHDSMFEAVIHTTLHFFDVNPIGEPGFEIVLEVFLYSSNFVPYFSALQDEFLTGFLKTLV